MIYVDKESKHDIYLNNCGIAGTHFFSMMFWSTGSMIHAAAMDGSGQKLLHSCFQNGGCSLLTVDIHGKSKLFYIQGKPVLVGRSVGI